MPVTTIALLAAIAPHADQPGHADLEYRTYRNWRIGLPAEVYTKVSGSLPGGFTVEASGTTLEVDTDGDGSTDRTVEGQVDDCGVRRATVTCRTATGTGRAFRLRNEGAGWHFAPSGAAIGKLEGTKVQFIDQDNDGRFDGLGTDAMIVGTGKRAQLLSEVVGVGDTLYSITVAPDGTSMSWEPFTGDSGVLDFTSALDAEAKLLSAVVISEDGKRSFDLAGAPSGLRVPAGQYKIHSGAFGLGTATVRVEPGSAKPLVVPANGRLALDWGGPVRAEFAFQREGDKVAFHPDYVWYYGAAGEQYLGWAPIGKSPTFTVSEKDTGDELVTAVFPGST